MDSNKKGDLSKLVKNRYELVIMASKRARQINNFFSSLKNGGSLPRVVPPDLDLLNEKPLTVALEEIRVGKVGVKRDEKESA